MEKPIESNLDESEQILPPKDEWFDAYSKGNLLVPQTGFGIEFSLLDAVLNDKKIDFQGLIDSKLSTEQLEKLRGSMDAAHGVKEIPNRSSEKIHEAVEEIKQKTGKSYDPEIFEIPDSDIERLWEGFTHRTLYLVGQLLHQSGELKNYNPKEVIRILEKRPDLVDKFKRLASSAIEALRSDEGKRLGDAYRDAFDLRKHGHPPNIKGRNELRAYFRNKALPCKLELYNYVINYILEKNSDLKEYLSEEAFSWRD